MHTVNRNARIMLVLFIFFSCYYNFSDAKLSKLQNSLYICSTERLLTEQPVATYHLCAIVSADNPLSGMSTISLQQLAKYKICTPARGMNARRMFDTLIHKHGVNLKPPCLCPSSGYIRNQFEAVVAFHLIGVVGIDMFWLAEGIGYAVFHRAIALTVVLVRQSVHRFH